MTDRGTLITVDGRPALRFERRYRHPIERVWRAVTDPDELAAWFPSKVLGERAVGAELVFDDADQRREAQEAGEPARADGPLVRGRVVAHDPPAVFSFTWGGELLRFELHPDGDGTRLVFTQLLSHPSVAARNASGWHACLAALDERLGAPVEMSGDGWEAVYADYLERMGPALAERLPDGALRWERGHHVEPDRIRAATSDTTELAAWGAGAHAGEPMRWEVEAAPDGSRFALVHDGIGDDPELAATWHALLVQLDMWLAAGQVVPVDAKTWVDDYRELLAR